MNLAAAIAPFAIVTGFPPVPSPETGAAVAREALAQGVPVRVLSGSKMDPEFAQIWIQKGGRDSQKDIASFVESVRKVVV